SAVAATAAAVQGNPAPAPPGIPRQRRSRASQASVLYRRHYVHAHALLPAQGHVAPARGSFHGTIPPPRRPAATGNRPASARLCRAWRRRPGPAALDAGADQAPPGALLRPHDRPLHGAVPGGAARLEAGQYRSLCLYPVSPGGLAEGTPG